MVHFLKSRLLSFQYAFAGWGYVLRTQRNARIHAAATAVVILVGLWLGLPMRDWTVIGLAIALVWMAECLDTALEAVVDLASPQRNPHARIAKDAGAAAVLIASLGSVWVGIFILRPPLWQRLQIWFSKL